MIKIEHKNYDIILVVILSRNMSVLWVGLRFESRDKKKNKKCRKPEMGHVRETFLLLFSCKIV